MFLDYSKINLKAGKGGNGLVSFRREKYVAKGGPNGGDGGDGGNIFFISEPKLTTLSKFRTKKHFKSPRGQNGRGKDQHGKKGEDLYIEVPVGTVVKNAETGEIIADLNKPGQKVLAAKGGKGGRGNARFMSSGNTAPKICENGTFGDELWIILELKLLSDAALIGFPNAGKSTLISRISNAKPKIADYPFTTLFPNLGVVNIDPTRSIVVSDIPGLIEGASENSGLGHRFLRHIERSKILIHLIEPGYEQGNYEELLEKYNIIRKELKKYSEVLSERDEIVLITKKELLQEQDIEKIKKIFDKKNIDIMFVSSHTGDGIKEMLEKVWSVLEIVNEKLAKEELEKKEEIPVFKIESKDEQIFSIDKKDGIYYVMGSKVEEFVQRTDLTNEYSVERLQRRLEKIGVFKALKNFGVKEEDEVEISGFRFTYFE